MHYHKIENNWIKAKHDKYNLAYCKEVCIQVKKDGYGWNVGWPERISIIKRQDAYEIIWRRHIRHFHFEPPVTKNENGFITWGLAQFNNHPILMKSEKTFSNAVQEALNTFDWLKNDLQILDETFYCFDEKNWCDESWKKLSVQDIDLSSHEFEFKEGLQQILVA